MYLYSLTYVRVKGVESGRYFKRQTCLITLVFPCARGWGNERSVNEDGSEIFLRRGVNRDYRTGKINVVKLTWMGRSWNMFLSLGT